MPSLFVCKKISSTMCCVYVSNICHVSFTITVLLIIWGCKLRFWFFNPLHAIAWLKTVSHYCVPAATFMEAHESTRVMFHCVLLSVKKGKKILGGWGRAGICTEEWSQLSFVFLDGSISPIWKATMNEFVIQCLELWIICYKSSFPLEHQHRKCQDPFSHWWHSSQKPKGGCC